MSKRNSKANLIMLAVVLAISLFLSFAAFSIPGTFTNYNGFINSIRLGFDLQGGASVVFEASLHSHDFNGDLNKNIDGTISRIQLLLEDKGYQEHYVYKQSGNKIVVEVPVLTDTEFLFDKLSQPANFKITTEEDNEAEARLSGVHIENAGYQVQQGQSGYQHGVAIAFNEEGKTLFAKLTKELAESGGNMYFYVGDDSNPITRMPASEEISDGSIFISGSNMTEDQAQELSLKVLSGSFSAKLKMLENRIISASLGKSALTMGAVAVFVIFALSLAFMIIRFKHFGILAGFASMFFMVLNLFFLQAVPFVRLTMSSFVALVAGVILNLTCYIVIYKKIEEENLGGKKLHLIARQGQRKALPIVADLTAVLGIFSLVLMIVASGTLKGFASALLISVAVCAFSTLVIFRFMLKNYLVLNSGKLSKFNLKKMES